MREADIALFYFSGHGTDLIDGKLVTPDFTGMDAGIPMSEILSMANKSKSKNKIIILDCCFLVNLERIVLQILMNPF